MNNKPLITYAGDIQVFQSVVPSLQKGIGAEAVEWKRAYGRTTKHVHLYPRFIPFDTGQHSSLNAPIPEVDPSVPRDPPILTTLLDQPMLHTFWTDCPDVEVYRTTTKDTIQSWLNQVKGCNIRDWLIIVVEAPDNKKTKQLLPRSSVLDRIKNDFAQKQVERCVSLSDPSKLDSKTVESLHTMLHRLRQLVLSSYSKTLTKFEENMRAQREKRNEPGWNFCHYFLLQEELAFVLEMLEVYDEALVQYDELDALFTQFVLNSHLTDTPQWLLSFQRSGERWPALNLSITVDSMEQIRTNIRNSTVTLLLFRNYLFSRQTALLIKQSRLNELAQRSLGFLHNCINELSILDVTFSEQGATSCWVFASCLEILGTICGHGHSASNSTTNTINGSDTKHEQNNDENLSDKSNKAVRSDFLNEQFNSNMLASDFSVHTASLWDYAREKLYDLGKIGALLPKSQPRSDYLHKVISLTAGLTADTETLNLSNVTNNNSSIKSLPSVGTTSIQNQNDTTDTSHISPIERLKNALASKEQFEKNYLELCELAMGTYKHIGRFRSARKVGLSLAAYYMDSNDYHKAIVFLTDALKTFRDDKWNMLVVQILLKLAHCYSCCNDMERYIKTCCLLACCKELNYDRRLEFFDEMISKLADSKPNHPILTSTEDSFVISSIKVETDGKIILNSCDVQIHLKLESLLPKSIECPAVKIAMIPTDPTHDHSLHHISTGSQSASPIPPGSSSVKGGKGNRRASTGGDGKNLKVGGGRFKIERKESVNPLTCEDEDLSLNLCSENSLSNVRLELGQTFDTKQDRTIQGGRLLCHNPHQALRRKDSQLKSDATVVKTDFSVSALSSQVIINPGVNSIALTAKVSNPNSYRLGQISIALNDLEFVSPRMGCKYTFNVEAVAGTITLDSGNSNLHLIAGVEQIVKLSIATGSNAITLGMALSVRASLGLQIKVHENSPLVSEASIPLKEANPFTTIQAQLTVKSELGPQKDNSLIEHKLIIKGPWSTEEFKIPIAFSPPFMSSYKLLTTKANRKFIQVSLHGLIDDTFLISNHQLVVQGNLSKDIPLVPLNPRSQVLSVTNGQAGSYMWEIGVTSYADETPIRLEFSATFLAKDSNIPPALYRYYLCPQKFKTMFEISYRIEPHKGTEFCRVGNMCTMIIEIMKQDKSISEAESSLMYEVRADQHVWAICGRTSGVVSMDSSEIQQVNLDVMPMSPGFLSLPTVYLSKYIPADQKANSSVPKLDPFLPGQVYNKCKGLQIHVLPPPQGSCSTATGGSSSGSSSIISGVQAES